MAYALSLLTYSLGAVFFGSPIPIKSIKKWGVLMMYDGLASAILVSVYSLLLKLGDYLLGILNASWPHFIAWLTSRTATLVTSYLAMQSIAAALRVSGADIMLELVKHVSGLVATSLTAVKMVYLISAVVYSLRDKILALGILLYTIPLRIGKSAGAAMIAASLVYYIGLPLMPAFASAFEASPLSIVSDRYGSISGQVVDAVGRHVPYAVVKLYSNKGDPVVIVTGDPEGKFYAGPPQDLLPVDREFMPEVVFMGYRLETDHASLGVPWSGTLRINNILYLGEGLALKIIGIVGLTLLEHSTISATIMLEVMSAQASLAFLKLDSVNISEILVNDESVPCSWSSFGWGGMVIEECSISLNTGIYLQRIRYLGVQYPRPTVEEKHYVDVVDVVEYLNIVQTTAVSYLYSYLLLPSVYLVVLSVSSYALSKFLGGGLKLRVV